MYKFTARIEAGDRGGAYVVVPLPEDFQNTLEGDPLAAECYHSLSYTHQIEYVATSVHYGYP